MLGQQGLAILGFEDTLAGKEQMGQLEEGRVGNPIAVQGWAGFPGNLRAVHSLGRMDNQVEDAEVAAPPDTPVEHNLAVKEELRMLAVDIQQQVVDILGRAVDTLDDPADMEQVGSLGADSESMEDDQQRRRKDDVERDIGAGHKVLEVGSAPCSQGVEDTV